VLLVVDQLEELFSPCSKRAMAPKRF
jgi:hypothetical protein